MRLLTPADVRELLRAHGIRPSRSLGQHFLADPNTARRIVRLAGVTQGDRVLEIGPGIGSLTLALAEAGAEVVAVERDRHVIPVLEEVLGDTERVTVVHDDALSADYERLLGGGRWEMVSNLPYNLATPIVVTLLERAGWIGRLTVMLQREVGHRFVARPRTKAYGAVTVKIAYYADASLLGTVPPTVFVPRPRVESVLVRLDRRPEPPVIVSDPARLFELVRAGFAQRRKMLGRSLRPVLGRQAGELLAGAGIDPTARAEHLGLEEWAALCRAAP